VEFVASDLSFDTTTLVSRRGAANLMMWSHSSVKDVGEQQQQQQQQQ
jgi:hypothetical protein